jgi:hypothetical protein
MVEYYRYTSVRTQMFFESQLWPDIEMGWLDR